MSETPIDVRNRHEPEKGAPGVIRTPDLLVRSPKKDGGEDEEKS
jgi:hypothetical protein